MPISFGAKKSSQSVPNIPLTGYKDQSLEVHIRSLSTTYFDGVAASVTSVNDTGEFDILAFHANFITLIKNFIILDKKLPTEKKIELKSAVLSVINGKVEVYVGV